MMRVSKACSCYAVGARTGWNIGTLGGAIDPS